MSIRIEYNLKEVVRVNNPNDEGDGPHQVDFRYVEVVTVVSSTKEKEIRTSQLLLLPSLDAVRLCASMATDDTINKIMEAQLNGWMRSEAGMSLPAVAQRIAQVAGKHTAWLPNLRLKYVNLRVDLRTGDWVIQDRHASYAVPEVLDLCKVTYHNSVEKSSV